MNHIAHLASGVNYYIDPVMSLCWYKKIKSQTVQSLAALLYA